MRDLIILLVHLRTILARLMGPGGLRAGVAESLLVKQPLLILNRSRHRAPHLRASDRILAGGCALVRRPARVLRSAGVRRPSTILGFHRTLRLRQDRLLLSPQPRRAGPNGPSKALVDAIVAIKRTPPRGGVRASPSRSPAPVTSPSGRTSGAASGRHALDRTRTRVDPRG